jgi:2-polyprenyl-3-methyl-5-hydroxy-6-metoxy-1,4-benzoquinol methylase
MGSTTLENGIFGKSREEIAKAIKSQETVLCPICSVEPTPFAVDYQGFQLCECGTCGTQFLSPRPVFEELLEVVYNDAYLDKEGSNTKPDPAELHLFERQLANYESMLGRTGTLLDVGCGRGTFLATARDRGWEIFGADVRLAPNAKRLGCTVWEIPLREIDFEGRQFDLIRFNHVLEHTQNPLLELEYSREILTADGILHVSVPNLAGIGSRLKSFQSKFHLKSHRWRHYAALHHLFFFTPDSLRLFTEKAGFRVIRIETPVLRKDNQSAFVENVYRNVLERFQTSNIVDIYGAKA